MSIKHARWALKDYVERLECDLDDESMSWHQRERWQHLLETARKGLAELDALEVAAQRYMQSWETADEARDLLATIASERQKREGP